MSDERRVLDFIDAVECAGEPAAALICALGFGIHGLNLLPSRLQRALGCLPHTDLRLIRQQQASRREQVSGRHMSISSGSAAHELVDSDTERATVALAYSRSRHVPASMMLYDTR